MEFLPKNHAKFACYITPLGNPVTIWI